MKCRYKFNKNFSFPYPKNKDDNMHANNIALYFHSECETNLTSMPPRQGLLIL